MAMKRAHSGDGRSLLSDSKYTIRLRGGFGNKSKSTEVRILGIRHGDFMVSQDPVSKKFLKQELKKETCPIFAEGIKRFVPRKFAARSEVLESQNKVADFYLKKWLIKFSLGNILSEAQSIIEKNARNLFSNLSKKKFGSASRLVIDKEILKGKELKRLFRATGLSQKQFLEALSMLVTMRSALMAAEAVEKIQSQNYGRVTVVVGDGHSGALQKFLENPKLGIRYFGFAQHKIHSSNELAPHEKEYLNFLLESAKEQFRKIA